MVERRKRTWAQVTNLRQGRTRLNATKKAGAKRRQDTAEWSDREGAPDPAISGAEAASLASHANAFACIKAYITQRYCSCSLPRLATHM